MNTTIQVAENTLERLKFYKQYSKESYDEILNKLIDIVEEGEMTDEAIDDIQKALKGIKDSKGQRIEDIAKEFGVRL